MLGPRLKLILDAEGISTYRLSKDLKIDQGQLSRYFNGKGSISIKKFERVLDRLGCEITLNKAVRGERKRIKTEERRPERIPMGLRLKEILKAEDKSTYRLSKELNIDQGQLSRYCKGKGSVSIRKYELILDHLGYEIGLSKTMRGEEKKIKGEAPASKKIPMRKDNRYALKCLKCGVIFPYTPAYGERLTSERLQHIECPCCFEEGCLVVIQTPTAFPIDTEKKKQVS